MDDDRLRFRVVEGLRNRLICEALGGGTLRARKGVNVLEHPVRLASLPDADREVCRVASVYSSPSSLLPFSYAFSFMLDGSEAAWLSTGDAHSLRPLVVGKIERAEALDNLELIAGRVDAIWICRGDLGAQLGPAAMAQAVAAIDPQRVTCPSSWRGRFSSI